MTRGALISLGVLIAIRLGIGQLHGSAHDALAVPLAPWQQAFVWIVIVVLPPAAFLALWRLRTRAALGWLAAIIAAGLLFGLYFHFGPMNPDHVSHQPPDSSGMLFLTTAVALAAIDLVILADVAWIGLKAGRDGG